jgi:ribosomal protein S18 acetylase RimI-like enzyme
MTRIRFKGFIAAGNIPKRRLSSFTEHPSVSAVHAVLAAVSNDDNDCPGGVKMSDTEEWRQGVATDATAIRDLTRAAYAKWVPVIGREPKPMTADYTQAVLKHRFDLIYINGKRAALIETIMETDYLLIENVAVSPSFQKRGLGRKLMAHAEKLATSSGFSEIKLYTNKLFTENIQLYAKLGYHVDREEAFLGGFLVHMSKPVPQPND